MELVKKLSTENIEKILSDNFVKLMPAFYEMQSSFLSGVYRRYGDLEGGHIVVFFAKNCHLGILRQRENNLNFDLSLDNFWNNHKKIHQDKQKIIYIAKETGLPKETTRRKILELIKKKHLQSDKSRLFWEPASEFKETYIKIITQQIRSLSKFIFEQSRYLDLSIPFNRIEKDIKKYYSFYWYHYLNVQLQYIKFWQEQLKDLEMLLIGLQSIIQTINYINTKVTGSFDANFVKKIPKNLNFSEANISATSISEVTGIPRATCIRKLEKFVKLNILKKDNLTKRYHLQLSGLNRQFPLNLSEDISGTELQAKKAIGLFGEFSSIVLRSMSRNK
tara:strand:+ start:175 stop:1176 length:1002 start_codon:yes stop_codon:yes gene_type:complete